MKCSIYRSVHHVKYLTFRSVHLVKCLTYRGVHLTKYSTFEVERFPRVCHAFNRFVSFSRTQCVYLMREQLCVPRVFLSLLSPLIKITKRSLGINCVEFLLDPSQAFWENDE